jgi:4-amino-4-deoxy-L-arabinose transferase-like glycosyltransferase
LVEHEIYALFMDIAFSSAMLIALTAACLGFGGLLLRGSGLDRAAGNPAETYSLGFLIGTGFIGWILFFFGIAGLFVPSVFWSITVAGIVALAVTHRVYGSVVLPTNFSPRLIAFLVLLVSALVFDFVEGVSPPADADTLASHFAVPKQFLAAGQIEFVPRAVTGAIPMLFHMTYAAALGMGGELTLTLWAMVSGWAAALLIYGIARRFTDCAGALALAIVFLTTPAVLYGGGSGQVETQCSGFVLASAFALVAGRETGSWRLLAVAGMLAGFFVGAKYFGLIFAGAAGLVLLFHRQGIRFALVFGFAAFVIGSQWYLWNWWHTGDPVFPSLFTLLGLPDALFWNATYAEHHSTIYATAENPLARTIANWLLYPIYATFDTVAKLESGRTGLGIILFLLLPLTVAGAFLKPFRDRKTIIFFALAAIFFTVWFASGTTQRVRHLLPIYPLLLIACYALALKASDKYKLARPFSTAVFLVLIAQIGGHSLFAANYAKYVFSDESRQEFLERNIQSAKAVFWINKNLSSQDRVAHTARGIAYLFDVPSFMLHPFSQAVIDFRPTTDDARRFVTQSTKQGINHFLLDEAWYRQNQDQNTASARMTALLIDSGCLKRFKIFSAAGFSSRTLAQVGSQTSSTTTTLFKLQSAQCPPEGADNIRAR